MAPTTPQAKSAPIVGPTGPLGVRGKNPKLRGAGGSSRRRKGRRTAGTLDGPGKKAAGDRQRARFRDDPAPGDSQPSEEEKDDEKQASGDENNHLSPPASPELIITY